MPFIESDKIHVPSHDLMSIETKGDKMLFNHIQNVTPDLEFCQQMRDAPGNGFSDDRQQRHIGRVPELLFFQHPEFVDNPDEIVKWLKSDEGKMFTTVAGGI